MSKLKVMGKRIEYRDKPENIRRQQPAADKSYGNSATDCLDLKRA